MSADAETKLARGLISFALAIPLTMLSGLVLSQLWGWFVSPLGVSKIGLWQAVGLTSCFSTFMVVHTLRAVKEGEDTLALTLASGVMLLCLWGLGAIYHVLMLKFG